MTIKNERVSKATMVKSIRKLIDGTKATTKFYSDEYWNGVQIILQTLRDNVAEVGLTDNEYFHNENGEFAGKRWYLEFPYTTKTGKPAVVYGQIIASAAGTVADPLSTYDLIFMVG